jgi:molybdopterin synthase sulfur carrier subunit
MKLRLLYFARLREALGTGVEDVTVPEGIDDVGALTAWLRTRGGAWTSELAAGRAYRVAVNQDMAHAGTRLSDGAEVAIFPPVTGG